MGNYWQVSPPFNRTNKFKDRSWTTVEGWDWNAKRIAYALISDGMRRGGYSYGITLLSPKGSNLEAFQSGWKAIKKAMAKRGIAAHFQVEVSKGNRWHVHGLSINKLNEFREVWAAIAPAGWVLRITERLKSWKSWACYICKTKRYSSKRNYPLPNLKINKHSTINAKAFWRKSVAVWWNELIDSKKSNPDSQVVNDRTSPELSHRASVGVIPVAVDPLAISRHKIDLTGPEPVQKNRALNRFYRIVQEGPAVPDSVPFVPMFLRRIVPINVPIITPYLDST